MIPRVCYEKPMRSLSQAGNDVCTINVLGTPHAGTTRPVEPCFSPLLHHAASSSFDSPGRLACPGDTIASGAHMDATMRSIAAFARSRRQA